MPFTKMLRPQYVAEFRCLGSECTDTCCQGWDVAIDRATYRAYKQLPKSQLKSLLDATLILHPNGKGDADYALIPLTATQPCPFLSEQRLCRIQETLGEDYLSVSCATYPRYRNSVDGVLEMSLFLSCPEAARLVLLDPVPMQFDVAETPALREGEQIPSLSSTVAAPVDTDPNGSPTVEKPFQYSESVRAFVLTLLQNRALALTARLLVLGVFCTKLGSIKADQYDQEVPALLEAMQSRLATGNISADIKHMESDLATQHQVVSLLTEHLAKTGPYNRRFLECYADFRQGIEPALTTEAQSSLPPGADVDATAVPALLAYTDAETRYYTPFMEENSYILENYLVNYAFGTLFPFGPQSNAQRSPRPIFTEYIAMALHYALIRGLLIGMAGRYRETFAPEQCVKLIQSYTKVAGHSLPYLKQSIEFIEACGLNHIEGMAALIF